MKRLPLIAGLSLATISLYFSATGLVHLFAGAGAAIVVMAIAFEVAKVSITAWLMQNLRLRFLPVALGLALLCLSAINSLGIYGFLGSAYAAGRSTAVSGAGAITVRTEEIRSLEADRDRLYAQIEAIPAAQGTNRRRLTQTLNPQIQSLTTALAAKRDTLSTLKRAQVTTENDIGELKFAAELFGTSQDGLAKLVITILAFLLDPLAVLLLLASGVKSRTKVPAAGTNEGEVTPARRVQFCTREQPHEGPCNGWPCEWRRSQMEPIRQEGSLVFPLPVEPDAANLFSSTETGRLATTPNEAAVPRSDLSKPLQRVLALKRDGARVTRRRPRTEP